MREAQAGNKSFDDQVCLTAYISALRDVYRLIQSDLSVEMVQRMLTLLREALEEASAASYVIDVEQATPFRVRSSKRSPWFVPIFQESPLP